MENSRYCNIMRVIAITLLLLIAINEIYLKLYSLWEVLVELFQYYGFKDYFMTFSPLVVTTMSILYLWLAKPKDLSKILVVCVLVIAYDTMIDAYLMLVEYRGYVNGDEETIKLTFFLEGALNLVVSVMLIINVILYSRGLSKSTALIKYSVFILLGVMVLMVIIDFRSGYPLEEVLKLYEDSLPMIMLLVFILAIINSKSVKLKTTTYTITSSIGDLRNSLVAMGLGIERAVALRLSDYNDKGLWCDSYSFVLTTYYREDYIMTLEKYGGSVLARISSVGNHTGVNNFRFHLIGLWSDTGDIHTCDLMRFYGEDGVFIQLIVRDYENHPKTKVPKIGSIILSSREPDTRSHRIMVKAKAIEDLLKGTIDRFRSFIRANTVGRITKKKE